MTVLWWLVAVMAWSGLCSALRLVSTEKADGPGVSVSALTAELCYQACLHHPQCDAVSFHPPSRKCRVFYRCSPYRFLSQTSGFLHYAKRPPVEEKGYTYESESDSCLKVVGRRSDYGGADKGCQEAGGRLASLHLQETNRVAAKLLRQAGAQYAWIGLTDTSQEGNPTHTAGIRVEDNGFFPRAEQEHRNDSTRNCWSLTDRGLWAEHSCKKRKQFHICQIVSYPDLPQGQPSSSTSTS